MTFLRHLRDNDPQPEPADESATLPVNPFKLAAFGENCTLIDKDDNEHPVVKGSALDRVYRSWGYTEKGKQS